MKSELPTKEDIRALERLGLIKFPAPGPKPRKRRSDYMGEEHNRARRREWARNNRDKKREHSARYREKQRQKTACENQRTA